PEPQHPPTMRVPTPSPAPGSTHFCPLSGFQPTSAPPPVQPLLRGPVPSSPFLARRRTRSIRASARVRRELVPARAGAEAGRNLGRGQKWVETSDRKSVV